MKNDILMMLSGILAELSFIAGLVIAVYIQNPYYMIYGLIVAIMFTLVFAYAATRYK